MNASDFFERYKWKGAKDSIGSGGFGKVFRAEDTLRNRKVAIKNSFVDSHKFTLKREVELVNELEPHPNVLRYENYYRFEVNNEMMDYAIMPFYKHGNLTNVISGGFLDMSQKLQVAKGTVQALVHLHKNKIVHRDLKPSNILMDFQNGNWMPKVADFGLSRFKTDVEQSVSNSSVGRSMPYAAPEQLMNGGKVNLHTDVWSLGTVLYELYTGRRAFQSDDSQTNSADVQLYHKIVDEQIPTDIADLPSPINKIVAGCLLSNGKNRLTIGQISGIIGEADDATILIGEVENQSAFLEEEDAIETKTITKSNNYALLTLGVIFIAASIIYFGFQKQFDKPVAEEVVEAEILPDEEIEEQLSKADNPSVSRSLNNAGSFTKPKTVLEKPSVEKFTATSAPVTIPIETSPHIKNLTTDSPIVTDTKTAQPIAVEIKTNKGNSGNRFVEGEEMKLYFKVNAPGFVRFVYRLADGNLVLLHDDYKVPESQVDKWVQVGSAFTCSAPFGAEEIIVFTSTEHFNSLRTRQDGDYIIIEEGLPSVISKSRTRGMKAKRDPVITTKSMNIITKTKS